MILLMKKQIAKIFINRKLREIGVNDQYLDTFTKVGADLYYICKLLEKSWDNHGDELKALLSDQIEVITKLVTDDTKLKDIQQCLEKIQVNQSK